MTNISALIDAVDHKNYYVIDKLSGSKHNFAIKKRSESSPGRNYNDIHDNKSSAQKRRMFGSVVIDSLKELSPIKTRNESPVHDYGNPEETR